MTDSISLTLDDHELQTREIQRRADKWLIAGTVVMGTLVLGVLGLPIFLRGLFLLRNAQREGLSVRPLMVTLIGYVIILDAALNSIGWALDLFANHALVTRTVFTAWGNLMDAGYFWHYNELWIGGASAPGEKAWVLVCVLIAFPMRMAAAIAIPSNEALGPPVADRHVLVRRRRVDRLHLQHDALRRRPLRRSRITGIGLVGVQRLLHHAISGNSLLTHGESGNLLRLTEPEKG